MEGHFKKPLVVSIMRVDEGLRFKQQTTFKNRIAGGAVILNSTAL